MLATLSYDLPRSVTAISTYTNPSVVERYMKEHGGTKEHADRCFHTLKQFLATCATTNGDRVVSKPVDNMWHTFILFTKDYEKFCEEYLGRFIHHVPAESGHSNPSPKSRTLAERLFGPVYEDLWPLEAMGDCESSGCDCCPAA